MNHEHRQQRMQQESERLRREKQTHACKNFNILACFFSSQFTTYEDDLRRENEEKADIQKRMETAQQESERLRRENQSHMATIRHFESEVRNT
jgi:hypothetical protein